MEKTKMDAILRLMHREIVPAAGCTEPAAVALCAARAREVLGRLPERVDIRLSANICKNALGVGIPGTGMKGLPIAVALGLLIGRSELALEVLRETTEKAVEEGRRLLVHLPIDIAVEEECDEPVYIRCEVYADGHRAMAEIRGTHTTFVRIERDGVALETGEVAAGEEQETQDPELTLREVYDFAMQVPLTDIAFLRRAAEMDLHAAEYSFGRPCGHRLGKMLRTGEYHPLFGKSTFTRVLAYTAGACDARMSGAPVSVMSNSGSGNQGISATVPVVIYGRENGIGEDALLRALALSNLTVIYIKQSLGRLSALCGCVVAATGSACGITRLMGGDYEEITYAVKNMVANITGMICDGAKPGCALKVTSGVSTAMLSAVMAMHHSHTDADEGIIDDDPDQCIRNMTAIGREGMRHTDRMILDIMTHKTTTQSV